MQSLPLQSLFVGQMAKITYRRCTNRLAYNDQGVDALSTPYNETKVNFERHLKEPLILCINDLALSTVLVLWTQGEDALSVWSRASLTDI